MPESFQWSRSDIPFHAVERTSSCLPFPAASLIARTMAGMSCQVVRLFPMKITRSGRSGSVAESHPASRSSAASNSLPIRFHCSSFGTPVPGTRAHAGAPGR